MLPQSLAGHLLEYDVSTVAREGWQGLTNGLLLRRSAEHGFAALITADSSMEHQQELSTIPLRILLVPGQTMPELLPLVPRIQSVLASALPGRLTRV